MKAVIPAAGLGTRFLPATKAQPKEMLPLVDKPTIQFVVEEAIASGIHDILIITGRGKRAIEDHFDKSIELENYLKSKGDIKLLNQTRNISDLANIFYVRQKDQKGLGDAIYCAKNHIGDEPFAVLLGDTIVESKVPCTKQMINFYNKYKSSIIAVEEVPKERIKLYGIIKGKKIRDSLYKIENLVEKPDPEKAPSNLGIIGRYILNPEIFDTLKKTGRGKGGEIQLTDALRILNKKQTMYAYEFKGKRYDIGDKFDYLRATVEFALERKDLGLRFREYIRGII